jgi:hypothetical protein
MIPGTYKSSPNKTRQPTGAAMLAIIALTLGVLFGTVFFGAIAFYPPGVAKC